jgi:hypothetical protein
MVDYLAGSGREIRGALASLPRWLLPCLATGGGPESFF